MSGEGVVRKLSLLVRESFGQGRSMAAHTLHTLTPISLLLQLLWRADADRKQQCSFKGKDLKVRLKLGRDLGRTLSRYSQVLWERA